MSERLDRIEKLIESNAKSIEALANKQSELSSTVKGLSETTRVMQREFLDLRREANRRWEDNQADIREMQFENQRILRYLESIVNRSGKGQING